jgi:hypothetical protein
MDRLREAAASGVRILIHPRHKAALGKSLNVLREAGAIETLEPWVNPETNRPAAISAGRLRSLSEQCLPVQASGAPVQFQINRTPAGWVVEIVNNEGVLKEPTRPAVVDESATAEVRLKLKETPSVVRELITGESLTVREGTVAVTVPPGSNRFVEFEVRRRADE